MDVYVNTSQFEFSHGARPRGYGSWGFLINGEVFWASPALYSAARAEAVAHARSIGTFEIAVAP